MKKELTWFQQSFEDGTVRYNVRHTPEGRQPFGFDYTTTHDALQENAVSRKRQTWDENDIVMLHGTLEGEVIAICEPPVKASPVQDEA